LSCLLSRFSCECLLMVCNKALSSF